MPKLPSHGVLVVVPVDDSLILALSEAGPADLESLDHAALIELIGTAPDSEVEPIEAATAGLARRLDALSARRSRESRRPSVDGRA